MPRPLTAEHGTIFSLENDFFGYFGWPTVARLSDGTLLVAASGLRNEHVCPFGRSVLLRSDDGGASWSAPRVINDGPLDDRDTGLVALGGRSVLLTWFVSYNRSFVAEGHLDSLPPLMQQRWRKGLDATDDALAARCEGSFLRISDDAGETWGPTIRVPVSSPHGPTVLRDGSLLYLGKERLPWRQRGEGRVQALRSADGGQTWVLTGEVPLLNGTAVGNYHEPHAIELPSGRLLGMIRVQDRPNAPKVADAGIIPFSILQTHSDDGGATWSVPRPLGFHGSPPHLLRHSSGVLVMVYGYRLAPFGQRVALSRDEGETWEHDLVLRDDGPDADLGYPSSVELSDGSILTVYYQKPHRREDKCALLCSRWRIDSV